MYVLYGLVGMLVLRVRKANQPGRHEVRKADSAEDELRLCELCVVRELSGLDALFLRLR